MIRVPRVHGNGFIQLDLNETTRLHIWGDSRIPKQQVASTIHNHIFDFKSTVLKGRLIHIEYNVKPNTQGRFKIYKSALRVDEDTELHDTGYFCDIVPYATKVVLAGQSYEFTAHRFHENYAPEPTVTIIKKKGLTLAQNRNGPRPSVLVPRGQEPENSFNRYNWDNRFLWSIIYEYTKFLQS